MKKIKVDLHYQMFIALILGIIGGLVFTESYDKWKFIANGVGQIFLHALSMIVVPLVFLSTVLCLSKNESTKSTGGLAVKTFGYFIVTALIAAILAIVIADVSRPGYHVVDIPVTDSPVKEIMAKANKWANMTWMDSIVNIVPKNIFEAFAADNMMPILFFSLMLGFFITKIQVNRRNGLNELFESFQEVIMRITDFIINLSPIGTFAIVMALVGEKPDKIKQYFLGIGIFVLVVWISLIMMGFILFVMVGCKAKVPPMMHLRKIGSTLMMAFSTRSSYSAMPLMMDDAKEKMSVSDQVTNFTIPMGITFNKVGTIIYECVAVLFVAQAFNIELGIAQQAMLIILSILTVLAAPSVPMAGVFFLAVLLKAMNFKDYQIEAYIGVLYAIDFLCDMPKTLLNVYSVSCGTLIVARSKGEKLCCDDDV